MRTRWKIGNRLVLGAVVCLGAVSLGAAAGRAQGPGGFALPVGYAEAIEGQVRQGLQLTGSVGSRRQSVVACEVQGLVVELRAREGDAVRRGQVLVRLRRETAELRLRAAEGQLKEARALLQLAEANRARAQDLFEEQVFSQQQLDDAMSQYEANSGRVAQLEAEVARLRDDLERTVVRAPFDGVVVREHTAVGEWLGAGDAVAEMVDTADLEVTLEVPEQFFAGLEIGTAVDVEVSALAGERFQGSVRALVPRADPQSRTFPVKVAVPNPHGRIGVGMLARVRLPVGEAQTAVMVPKDAVVSRGEDRLIFFLDEENQAQPMPVVLGYANGDWLAVTGGVEPGMKVVVQGNERLQPGQPVQPQPVEVARP